MVYCANKSKAIIEINGERVWQVNHPPITVEISEETKCEIVRPYVDYEFRGIGSWISTTTSSEVFGPVTAARFLREDGDSLIQVLAHGDIRLECVARPTWVTIRSIRPRVRNVSLNRVEPSRDGETVFSLSIRNKNNVEEFLKNYEERPEFKVICGCDETTELECKSDNENGFCCISCNNLVSKLRTIESKLNK